jgi:hypothetical protein
MTSYVLRPTFYEARCSRQRPHRAPTLVCSRQRHDCPASSASSRAVAVDHNASVPKRAFVAPVFDRSAGREPVSASRSMPSAEATIGATRMR